MYFIMQRKLSKKLKTLNLKQKNKKKKENVKILNLASISITTPTRSVHQTAPKSPVKWHNRTASHHTLSIY